MPLNDFLEPMFDAIKGNHKGLPLQVVDIVGGAPCGYPNGLPLQVVDIVGVPLVGTLWH